MGAQNWVVKPQHALLRSSNKPTTRRGGLNQGVDTRAFSLEKILQKKYFRIYTFRSQACLNLLSCCSSLKSSRSLLWRSNCRQTPPLNESDVAEHFDNCRSARDPPKRCPKVRPKPWGGKNHERSCGICHPLNNNMPT